MFQLCLLNLFKLYETEKMQLYYVFKYILNKWYGIWESQGEYIMKKQWYIWSEDNLQMVHQIFLRVFNMKAGFHR